jgi:uncharacterized repeat protein (TIGR03843 family)
MEPPPPNDGFAADEFDDDEFGEGLDDDEFDDDEEDGDDDGEVIESPFLERDPIPVINARALLADGVIEVVGRMPYSSNATFLVGVDLDGLVAQAIYKPVRGERPLWDFPGGLHRREAAAFELSEWFGWSLVPPTIERDGPFGIGSIQLFVPSDFAQHYFTIRDAGLHLHALQRLTVFDVVANNTDRKGGHVLLGHDGAIWAIDNGLSFHVEDKLRTVLWDFGGEHIPRDILDNVVRLLDEGVPAPVADRLDPFERDAMLTRARAIVTTGRFPTDPTGRRYPWPLV